MLCLIYFVYLIDSPKTTFSQLILIWKIVCRSLKGKQIILQGLNFCEIFTYKTMVNYKTKLNN